jgi:hypothetical protein
MPTNDSATRMAARPPPTVVLVIYPSPKPERLGGLDASPSLRVYKLSLRVPYRASPRLEVPFLLLKKEPTGYKRHSWVQRGTLAVLALKGMSIGNRTLPRRP